MRRDYGYLCGERLFGHLTEAERFVRIGERELGMRYRETAKQAYRIAHRELRSAIGLANSCSTVGQVSSAFNTLARLAMVADRFEHFEERIERSKV